MRIARFISRFAFSVSKQSKAIAYSNFLIRVQKLQREKERERELMDPGSVTNEGRMLFSKLTDLHPADFSELQPVLNFRNIR